MKTQYAGCVNGGGVSKGKWYGGQGREEGKKQLPPDAQRDTESLKSCG